MKIGDGEITKDMMPSYVRGEDYPYRLYQMKQDLLNKRLFNNGNPVQTVPAGAVDQNSQWSK